VAPWQLQARQAKTQDFLRKTVFFLFFFAGFEGGGQKVASGPSPAFCCSRLFFVQQHGVAVQQPGLSVATAQAANGMRYWTEEYSRACRRVNNALEDRV
jgi:hypothetical protein